MLEEVARKSLDTRAWGRAHTKAFVDFAFNEPNTYRLVYDLLQPEEAKYPELARANARADVVMAAYARRLIDEGIVEGDPNILGYQYFAAIHGLIVLRMAGRRQSSREEFDMRCRTLLRAITRGNRPSK